MKRLVTRSSLVLGLVLAAALQQARAAESILEAIPDDALGFVVVHQLSEASGQVDQVAQLVGAPAPGLLAIAKQSLGVEGGLDERGDVAMVFLASEPMPKVVALAQVKDYEAFARGLGADDAGDDIAEVELAGKPSVIAPHGSYAVMAPAGDREAIEQFLAADGRLGDDEALAKWVASNAVSVNVTRAGVEFAMPKLVGGVQMIQATMRQMGGDQAEFAAEAMNMYVDLFKAAEAEVDSIGFGVRVASDQSVALVSQARFVSDGAWGKLAEGAQPGKDLIAGLPDEPFCFAIGGVMPEEGMKRMMKFSLRMMEGQSQFKLSPEQAKRYLQLTADSMKGIKSMRMLLGVPEKDAGVYGNAVATMTVDDAEQYLANYQKVLAGMTEIAEESKSPGIPRMTSSRIEVNGKEAVEVTMDMKSMAAAVPNGGAEMEEMMKKMMGPTGTLKVYLAPVDDHTVAMAYTSVDNLKKVIKLSGSSARGLAENDHVAASAKTLPADAQAVGFLSIQGTAELIRRLAPQLEDGPAKMFAEAPASPPIGMALNISDAGAEAYLTLPAATLQSLGEAAGRLHGQRPE
jgi:hypothetical protein